MLFKNKFFNKYLAFIFVITFLFVIDTVHAYPDMKEQGADETASESTDNLKEEKADPKNLKECKMQAKSKKDAKDCEKKFMKTIDEFIARTTQWLQKNIGKRSKEEPSRVDKQPGGMTMISGGKPEGYYNRIIKRMNEIARDGKKMGATHVGVN